MPDYAADGDRLPQMPAVGGAVVSATRILEWRPLRRNSLLGLAKVKLPSGLVTFDVTIQTGEHGPG